MSAVPDDGNELGERLIAAVAAVSAPVAGKRSLHAKGVGATGVFRSTGGAAGLTTAAHLEVGVEVPVTVRFSNGSAAVQADGVRDGRGFAVAFHLDDGTRTDIVALTLPVFFVRTPDDFLGLMAARVPDPETGEMDLNKVFAFLGEHPEAQQAVELSMAAPVPASYGTVAYHGIHAFWFEAADGSRQAVRYRWDPDAGVESIDDETAAAGSPDRLADELADRLATGHGVGFTLVVALAGPDDDVTDPTTAWPDDRTEIVAGHLTLTALADAEAVEAMIFDPTRVTPGIVCTDDQILHARSAAYSASYARRTTSA